MKNKEYVVKDSVRNRERYHKKACNYNGLGSLKIREFTNDGNRKTQGK